MSRQYEYCPTCDADVEPDGYNGDEGYHLLSYDVDDCHGGLYAVEYEHATVGLVKP